MATKKRIRVLIADRQPVFCSGLHHLLSRKPGIFVVGEAENREQALEMVKERKPAILLLDSLLIESNGSELLQELQKEQKTIKVILLTPQEEEENSVRDLRTKAAGVIPKQSPLDVLIQCIRKVDSGEAWEEPKTAQVPGNESSRTSPPSSPAKNHSLLSTREKQVVGLVAQGYRNKEIAERMFIS